MDILLLILKIIGIVLLSVIGLVLFLLLLLLLMPIRYSGEAAYADDKPDVHVRASYLFIVRARADFTDKLVYSLKAAWITIMSSGEDDGSHKKKKPKEEAGGSGEETAEAEVKAGEDSAEKGGKAATPEKTDDTGKEGAPDAAAGEDISENFPTDDEDEPDKKALTGDEDGEEADIDKKALKARKKAEKKAAKEAKKAKKAAKKAANKAGEETEEEPGFFDKLYETIKKYLDKAEYAIQKADEGKQDVETFFKRKSTKFAIEKIKIALIKILKHIRPRKLKGELEFGLEDPSQTGMILGAVSAFYITDDKFILKPNFDEKVIDGRVEFAGHILLGVIVYHALALYLRKQVRQFIHNAQELKDSTMDKVDEIKNIFVTGES